jgi:hypothetical protein
VPSNKKQELVEEMLNKANDCLERLSGDETPRKLYLKALYYRGIELAQASLDSLNNSKYSAAAILLRSLLEVYVDFANLVLDKKYFLVIEANDLRNRIKRNKSILNNSDKDESEIRKEIEQQEERIKHLKENGGKELNIFQRFKKINHMNVYREIYTILSDETHANFASIERMHIGHNGKEFYIDSSLKSAAYRELVLTRVAKSISTMSIGIHVAYNTKYIDEFKQAKDAI